MKYLSILFLSFWTVSAQANYQCWGNVTYLGVDESLYVDNGYGVHKLCVLTAENNEKCKAWLAMAMSAQAQGKPLHVYYKNPNKNSTNSTDCAAVGNWVAPEDEVYFITLQQ